ncbi:hypothetical protein Chor_016189 [Crotalus horridus]
MGKAVHALSRIGDEIYIEPVEEGLSLRAINTSRSAYACFLFTSLFFQHYQAGESGSDPDVGAFRCKVLMKECELLQAVFDKTKYAHLLRASPRLLADAVVHFPLNLAEVTLGASPGGKVTLRSYLEEDTEPSRMMVTEMCMSEDEFQVFHIKQEIQVTFCLKEFRGFLSFAESSNLSLDIHFDEPGRPAIFTVEDPVLELQLVLATLSESESHLPANTHKPVAPASDFTSDDIDTYMIAMETTCDETEPSPSHAFATRHPSSETRESESENEDTVLGTPPQKRFRSLFFGSVLSESQLGSRSFSSQDVLAEDSEGDS